MRKKSIIWKSYVPTLLLFTYNHGAHVCKNTINTDVMAPGDFSELRMTTLVLGIHRQVASGLAFLQETSQSFTEGCVTVLKAGGLFK